MLMRVALNKDLLNLDEALNFFISKKQNTFKQYVENKMAMHLKKSLSGKISAF